MLDQIIGSISNFMYSYLLIVLLLAAGLYFTIRTKFVQFRLFSEIGRASCRERVCLYV